MATDDEARCWQSALWCILLFFLPFFKYIFTDLIKGCAKLVVTFVKVFFFFAAHGGEQLQPCKPKACMHMQSSTVFNVCCFFSSPPRAGFQHENAKLFGNLLPGGPFMQGSHIELSSARMFDAASVVEHMPHSVLVRLFAH